MNRKEFLKISALFGLSLPFQSALVSCKRDDPQPSDFDGKVLIIGAGAGGLAAAYFLRQRGIECEILEASGVHGGRMRTDNSFADFPIPLGAEWLETGTGIFDEIVNDPSVQVSVNTVPDAPDRKFVDYSWLDFFDDYIVPSVADRIRLNTVVTTIDTSGAEVVVTTTSGEWRADKVIVSVPLKILQDNDIQFLPALPQEKTDAIGSLTVWEGFKAFFEFSQKFYQDEYVYTVTPASDGERIYYNASLGQNTNRHILGLFVVGKPAQIYQSLSGNALRDHILSELDGLYGNQATPNFIKYRIQDWNAEPYIKGGYLSDAADWRTVKKLGEPVGDKLFFAGGEYTDGEDWVSVHVAAQSAKVAVDALLVS